MTPNWLISGDCCGSSKDLKKLKKKKTGDFSQYSSFSSCRLELTKFERETHIAKGVEGKWGGF